MKRKPVIVIAIIATVLIVLLLPVLITQLVGKESRSYQGVRLEDTSYQEISFQNPSQDIKLGGMLFVPNGEGLFPAAVIIHGSGTSRRDSKWYLTLTQYLQNNGVVVLLPDKRGSEQSEGDWRTSSFEDLATDTLAAVSFLKDQDNIAVSHIGVIGMSQGGWIAPIVANKMTDVAFLVNMVGPAVTVNEQLLYEENYNLREMGVLPGISNIIAFPSTFVLTKITMKDFFGAVGNFDSIPYWEKLTTNSLVLYGQEDTNLPSEKSAAILRSLNKSNIEVKIYEGSGHALQDPEGRGDNIIRNDALRDILTFINMTSDLQSNQNGSVTGEIGLEDKIWVLKSYGEAENLKSVLEDTEVTVTFNSGEGQVTGSAGCNSYFGSYETEDANLSISGPIGATEMSCGEQKDTQEREYLGILQATESYEIEGGKLTINCGNQVLIFESK